MLTQYAFISTIIKSDFALFCFLCLYFSYSVLSEANGEACNRRSSGDAKPQLFSFHFPIAFAASKTDEPRDLYSEKQIVSTCNHSSLFSAAWATAGRLRFKDNSGVSSSLQCRLLLPFVSGPQSSAISQTVLSLFLKTSALALLMASSAKCQ